MCQSFVNMKHFEYLCFYCFSPSFIISNCKCALLNCQVVPHTFFSLCGNCFLRDIFFLSDPYHEDVFRSHLPCLSLPLTKLILQDAV